MIFIYEQNYFQTQIEEKLNTDLILIYLFLMSVPSKKGSDLSNHNRFKIDVDIGENT